VDLHNESLEVENASEVNEESEPVPETYLRFIKFYSHQLMHFSHTNMYGSFKLIKST